MSILHAIVLVYALVTGWIIYHFFVREPRRIDKEYEEKLRGIVSKTRM